MKSEEQIRARLEALGQSLERVSDIPALRALYIRDIDTLEWVLEK